MILLCVAAGGFDAKMATVEKQKHFGICICFLSSKLFRVTSLGVPHCVVSVSLMCEEQAEYL